jgi:hypothetical protein
MLEKRSEISLRMPWQRILPPTVAYGLKDILKFGNQAAPGYKVSREAADWVLNIGGPLIVVLEGVLDSDIPNPK